MLVSAADALQVDVHPQVLLVAAALELVGLHAGLYVVTAYAAMLVIHFYSIISVK